MLGREDEAEPALALGGKPLVCVITVDTGVENPEPLRNRGEIKDFDDTIADIASQVQQNPDAVMYGTFHSWRDPGV